MQLPDGYTADSQAAFALMKTRARLSIDDVKVLALLESAAERFYSGLAQQMPNEEARALLMRNGQEELGHAHRLVKAIRLLGGESFELPSAAENPFLQTPAPSVAVTPDFLELFALGEADGDLQYHAWADAEPNPDVAKIYRQNGVEETRHGERLTQVRAMLLAHPGG
jgi:Rubrerythrin